MLLLNAVRFCFWTLVLFQVVRIWTVPYYPSQDGPSHLYNAAILARYDHVAIFRDFYTIHISPAGNVLAQLLQWVLLKTAGEFASERVLLTIYAVLLPLSFRALLESVTGRISPFILIGPLILPNFFFTMGFWNFCLSIPILFLTLAWLWKWRNRWRPASVLALGILSFLTYSAHMLSWAVLAIAVCLQGGIELFRARKTAEWSATLRNVAVTIPAATAPVLLALAHLHSTGSGLDFGGTLAERTWPLYSAAFLRGFGGPADRWFSYTFEALIVSLFAGAAAYRWRKREPRAADVFLLFAVACALISIFGPRAAASGAYLRDRTAFYAWMFLVVWLASTVALAKVQAATAIALAGLAVAGFAARVPAENAWSRELGEYASARPLITTGKTILAVRMEPNYPTVDPLLHAVGLVALDGAIDLQNYEARLPYFSVQLRPDQMPTRDLGESVQKARPEFDIPQYEKASGKRVDYLLFYGGEGWPELQNYGEKLTDYQRIFVSRPSGRVRLYTRR
jgi:hypothetical protein